MNADTLALARAGHPTTLPPGAPAAARRTFALLARLPRGTLDVQLPDGGSTRFGSGAEPRAVLRLHDWAACARALQSGDIGFAEGWIAGEWSSPDLTALLRLFIANRDHVEQLVYGSWWGSLLHRLQHWRNRNSRAGSRRNIHAHYDLGNAFYRLWLDETLSYSAACFDGDPTRPLAQAQVAKVERALRSAGVQADSRLLEIGCGWGALAEIAAQRYGAQVTGITLSTEQLAWGRERLARAGLAGRCELRLQDYRDLPALHAHEPFDAIVSIEMFEAVGREYWPGYFDTLRRCLKPGGRACVQTITIRDDLFERYARSTDFIQQYIFPGGLLPSDAAFRAEAARAGLVVEATHAFGADYARTLRLWHEAFLACEAEVRAQGFDERFMRIWTFYLAYCEAAFAEGNTDVVQYTLRRPA
jgi:cyclopropane-fatty-acyl-phospholipid synthase